LIYIDILKIDLVVLLRVNVFSALVRTAENANITPVLTDKHRLPGWQSGHRKTRFIRMMSWEIQGIGTKEWAGHTAPFFACKKAKTRARRVFYCSRGAGY
jgi:hypothetical protein